jgi:hypothetical protein
MAQLESKRFLNSVLDFCLLANDSWCEFPRKQRFKIFGSFG